MKKAPIIKKSIPKKPKQSDYYHNVSEIKFDWQFMCKYKYGDKVKFKLEGKDYEGTIYIIDKYGTFENPGKTSYDILSERNGVETLFKHIPESEVNSQ